MGMLFEVNRREHASDWVCKHCLRYNPEANGQCRMCDQPCEPGQHHLKQAQAHASTAKVGAAAAATGAITGLCLRNRTLDNLWLYTEQTAPLEWVHLRPGESCDMPVGRVWYTIGASFDEPSATTAILAQL